MISPLSSSLYEFDSSDKHFQSHLILLFYFILYTQRWTPIHPGNKEWFGLTGRPWATILKPVPSSVFGVGAPCFPGTAPGGCLDRITSSSLNTLLLDTALWSLKVPISFSPSCFFLTLYRWLTASSVGSTWQRVTAVSLECFHLLSHSPLFSV